MDFLRGGPIFGEKKREPEPGRTGTGPNRNRTEPEPTETEPNRTEPWDSWDFKAQKKTGKNVGKA